MLGNLSDSPIPITPTNQTKLVNQQPEMSIKPWQPPETPAKLTARTSSRLKKPTASSPSTPPPAITPGPQASYFPPKPIHMHPLHMPMQPMPMFNPMYNPPRIHPVPVAPPKQQYNHYLARLLDSENALIWSTSREIREPMIKASIPTAATADSDTDEYESDDSEIIPEKRGTRRTLGLAPVSTSNSGVISIWTTKKAVTFPRKKRDLNYRVFSSGNLLVPVRINMDLEDYKFRDCFMWNESGNVLEFVQVLCDDLGLVEKFVKPIADVIKNQVAEFVSVMEVFGKDLENNLIPQDTRVIIRLDINVGRTCIRDQFEWDLAGNEVTPEKFAETLVSDLGLGREFITLIAHSIHEQIFKYRALWVESSDPLKFMELGSQLHSGFRWLPESNAKLNSILQQEAAQKELEADLAISDDEEDEVSEEMMMVDSETPDVTEQHLEEMNEKSEGGLGVNLEAQADIWAPKVVTLSAQEYDRIVQEKDRNVRRTRREYKISDNSIVDLSELTGILSTPSAKRWRGGRD